MRSQEVHRGWMFNLMCRNGLHMEWANKQLYKQKCSRTQPDNCSFLCARSVSPGYLTEMLRSERLRHNTERIVEQDVIMSVGGVWCIHSSLWGPRRSKQVHICESEVLGTKLLSLLFETVAHACLIKREHCRTHTGRIRGFAKSLSDRTLGEADSSSWSMVAGISPGLLWCQFF